jgi:hypothetical protein
MSAMQPPRSRTPRLDLADTETLRAVILNLTAGVSTLLILRFATLLVRGSDDSTVPGYIQLVTEPLIWPFQFVPLLNSFIIHDAQLIDALIIPAVVLIGLLVAGILSGWRDTVATSRTYDTRRGAQ